MKLLIGILTAILMIGTSQANTNLREQIGTQTVIVAQRPTATRSAPVRVKIQKPKLFTGNPHKVHTKADDWDDNFVEVDDIITSYRRRDISKIEHEDGISEKVRWRLFLARQLALIKYRQTHG
jgi:hypothetical protein